MKFFQNKNKLDPNFNPLIFDNLKV